MMKHLWIWPALAMVLVSPAAAQNNLRDRDEHFRGDPAQRHYRNNYKPPRVYYPRKDQDKMRVRPVQPPSSVPTPEYGAPPPAIERIPKT